MILHFVRKKVAEVKKEETKKEKPGTGKSYGGGFGGQKGGFGKKEYRKSGLANTRRPPQDE